MDRFILAEELKRLVGPQNVYWKDYDLMLYEYDGSIDKERPIAAIFPTSSQQVADVVRFLAESNVPFTARGAGTGLSGGSIPLSESVLIVFSKLNHIISTDFDNLRAVVEPGVVNLHLSQAIADSGLCYVPDPSSQKACTIGGNVGENSGGPHTLRYGVTTNHVLGLEVVLPNAEVVEFGGPALDYPGYDLTGLFVGSEGTFGIATKVIVKLLPIAEATKTILAIFDQVVDASEATSGIIAAGIVPSALEMMDKLSIQAVEAAVHAGYPTDAAAVLLIEVDSLKDSVDELVAAIDAVCQENHAREVRIAKTARERHLLWLGRKGAFGAMGRISPDFYVMDGCVPRNSLPKVLARIDEISKRFGLRVANVFHAGDGNLHPLVLFDSEHPGEEEMVREMGAEILGVCAEVGGSLTGEHGIGMEKRDLMGLIFNDDDLNVFKAIKDAFDPDGVCNPGKVLPMPGKCWTPRPGRSAAIGW